MTTAFCRRCDSEDCHCGPADLLRLAPQDQSRNLEGIADPDLEGIADPDLVDGAVGRTVPAPSNPMGVARAIVRDVYTSGADHLLRCHRGDFYGFDGAYWPEAEARGIRGALYEWLERAVYIKTTKDGFEQVAWEPTRHKVDDVLDALRAVVYLDGAVESPAWTNGAQDLPAREVIVVNNGLLHVPTRTLLRHTPTFFAHNRLAYDYDPEAPTPSRFLSFLEELWGDDEDSIRTLQEIFGCIIGGDTRQQKIFLLVGPRRSGKGTIGRVLTGLLGKHNVAAPTLAGMATNFGLQELIDRPLGLISDARLGSKADSTIVVERMLSISGEDSITIDRKYRDPWTGRLPTRLMVLTNELPSLADSSGALSSRFVLLMLTRSFLGNEDPGLSNELLQGATGILNWALEGLDRLNVRGYFEMPAASREALTQLEDLTSPVAAFIRQRCEIGADHVVSVDDLWRSWKSWCEDENRHPGTKAKFGRDLKASAPTVHRARHRDDAGTRHPTYEGIGLRGDNNAQSLGTRGTEPPETESVPSVPRTKPLLSPGKQDDDLASGGTVARGSEGAER